VNIEQGISNIQVVEVSSHSITSYLFESVRDNSETLVNLEEGSAVLKKKQGILNEGSELKPLDIQYSLFDIPYCFTTFLFTTKLSDRSCSV
jgi:hypothetical protein